ncbi:MAG: hypothetical protein JWN40_2421 [Phycisphaerales bacterium]|nr:hypothetical protein [Phycisphaerales bacterium]
MRYNQKQPSPNPAPVYRAIGVGSPTSRSDAGEPGPIATTLFRLKREALELRELLKIR